MNLWQRKHIYLQLEGQRSVTTWSRKYRSKPALSRTPGGMVFKRAVVQRCRWMGIKKGPKLRREDRSCLQHCLDRVAVIIFTVIVVGAGSNCYAATVSKKKVTGSS